MFKLKRNQVIISALVLMIVIAGYLSYIDRAPSVKVGDEFATTLDNEIGALVYDEATGQTVPVINLGVSTFPGDETDIALSDSETQNSTADDSNEPGEAVFVNTTNDSSFFVQAKLDREQARSRERELLTDMINSTSLEKDKKAACADALLTIQNRIEKESATESMIEAKGFGEVYVRIDDTTVDIIVNQNALSDAETAQIEDIVTRKTGMSIDQIRISPMKQDG